MTFRRNRRDVLRAAATSAAASSIASGAVAQDATAAPPSAASQPEGVCVLFPQAVEGPYYFDPKLVRSDITEGRPGMPLKLVLKIIEQGPCTPIANARVDVWHADAGGIYSGYPGQGDMRNVSTKGERYLRGTQMTQADGSVTFDTIYPGWYPGRTPHIHVKVFLDTATMLTGQVYFPDDMSARIYKGRAPYASRPVADTTNSSDFLFKQGEREGGGTMLAVSEDAGRVVGTLLIAVDRSGEAARKAGSLWRRWLGR